MTSPAPTEKIVCYIILRPIEGMVYKKGREMFQGTQVLGFPGFGGYHVQETFGKQLGDAMIGRSGVVIAKVGRGYTAQIQLSKDSWKLSLQLSGTISRDRVDLSSPRQKLMELGAVRRSGE